MPEATDRDDAARCAAPAIPVDAQHRDRGRRDRGGDRDVCGWRVTPPHWTLVVAAAFVFSFANNTIFSLLHECVHGAFSPRPPAQRSRRRVVRRLLPDRLHDPARQPFRPPPPQPHRSRALRLLSAAPVALAEDLLDLLPAHRLLLGDHPGGRASSISSARSRSAAAAFQNGPAKWWGFGEFVRDIAAEPIARVWPQALFTFALQVVAVASLASIGSAGSPATGPSASTGARCNTPIMPGARATCTRAPGTCASGRSPRRSSSTTTSISCITAGRDIPWTPSAALRAAG